MGRTATGEDEKHPPGCPTPVSSPVCALRRNPAHFLESSHPGDSDYEVEEEKEEAERPECPYGTDCYRSVSKTPDN